MSVLHARRGGYGVGLFGRGGIDLRFPARDSCQAPPGNRRSTPRPHQRVTAGRLPTTAGIEGIVAAVRNTVRERVKLRGVLERIQAVVADALA